MTHLRVHSIVFGFWHLLPRDLNITINPLRPQPLQLLWLQIPSRPTHSVRPPLHHALQTCQSWISSLESISRPSGDGVRYSCWLPESAVSGRAPSHSPTQGHRESESQTWHTAGGEWLREDKRGREEEREKVRGEWGGEGGDEEEGGGLEGGEDLVLQRIELYETKVTDHAPFLRCKRPQASKSSRLQ